MIRTVVEQLQSALAEKGSCASMRFCGDCMVENPRIFAVQDDLWCWHIPGPGTLCLLCAEKRLGRLFATTDFKRVPANDWVFEAFDIGVLPELHPLKVIPDAIRRLLEHCTINFRSTRVPQMEQPNAKNLSLSFDSPIRFSRHRRKVSNSRAVTAAAYPGRRFKKDRDGFRSTDITRR
jgi:hypothetical protein